MLAPAQLNHAYQRRIKLLTMGASNVGKSCLIKRFCEEKFVVEYIATIGVDYGVKTVKVTVAGKPTEVRVDFFDTAGDSAYSEIRNEFYNEIQILLLVFDVTNPYSFTQLNSCMDELLTVVKETGQESFDVTSMHVVVMANKMDQGPRRVSADEVRNWSKNLGYQYFETSAANGNGVATAFTTCIETFLQRDLIQQSATENL